MLKLWFLALFSDVRCLIIFYIQINKQAFHSNWGYIGRKFCESLKKEKCMWPSRKCMYCIVNTSKCKMWWFTLRLNISSTAYAFNLIYNIHINIICVYISCSIEGLSRRVTILWICAYESAFSEYCSSIINIYHTSNPPIRPSNLVPAVPLLKREPCTIASNASKALTYGMHSTNACVTFECRMRNCFKVNWSILSSGVVLLRYREHNLTIYTDSEY